MKKIKILSAFLAVLMFCGALTVIPVGAIPAIFEGADTNPETGIIDYAATIEDYLTLGAEEAPLSSAKAKLDLMKLMWANESYEIYADAITGEVAVRKIATDETIFSNPWDITTSKTNSMDEKKKLLSQIIINYTDNGTGKIMNSTVDAAMRGQINIKHIKNGIRVEYAIGRQNSRFLVPRIISKTAFESKILVPMREAVNNEIQILITARATYRENEQPITKYPNAAAAGKIEVGKSYSYYDLIKLENPSFDFYGTVNYTYDHQYVKELLVYYQLYDPNAADVTDKQVSDMHNAYPITKKMAVYVFDESAKNTDLIKAERHIKTWVQAYSFEQLDADHLETEYEGTTKSPALFKLALEYTIDDKGFTVRLPANGIRFDESLYQLDSITVLPYMGAGKSSNGGYNFFPDGSGALFDYEQLNNGSNTTLAAQVYGTDFAYHKLTGKHQETVRYPVFGSVENWKGGKTVIDYNNLISAAVKDENGNIIKDAVYGTKIASVEEKHGFLAIIEEGDSMAQIATSHQNGSSEYSSMQMTFFPRPSDTYNMADAISVGANTDIKVVSSRKYVGSYKIRYIMLTDEKVAADNRISNYYECSWVGMAQAYRDYLEYQGVLSRISDEDANPNIPLYVESFGTVETVEKILSMPVNVMTPLTTFEDISTMYKELSEAIEKEMGELKGTDDAVAIGDENSKKFNNINFKLTGYANGGMYSTVPYHLNWEESVGGAAGFEKLVEEAREEGFGIFPDFDFVYINQTEMFDGVSLMDHAVKTIDNRYTSRRAYDATYQTYVGYYELAISPAFFARFVTKFSINYMKYNPMGISVSTLGTDLNSDFDDEDPYNREDAMQFTVSALRQLSLLTNEYGERMQVMIDGGNSYTLKYADHIVNAPTSSSNYNYASNTVPFVGVVLHGYKNYAGTPINEEGNLEAALLRAIENGSGLYFKLSYQNTDVLKDFNRLSENYSIRYDIWKDDVVDMYVELNNLLADLQTKLIIDHDFLIADRIPDASEAEADRIAREEAEALKEAERLAEEAKEALKEALELRKTPGKQSEAVTAALKLAADQAIKAAKAAAKIDDNYVNDAYATLKAANEAAKAADEAYAAAGNSLESAAAEAIRAEIDAILALESAKYTARMNAIKLGVDAADIDSGNFEKYETAYKDAEREENRNFLLYGGSIESVTSAVNVYSAVVSAQKARDTAYEQYQAVLNEVNSPLGSTAEERAELREKQSALSKAETKLKEAKEKYELLNPTGAFAATVEATVLKEEAKRLYEAAKAAVDAAAALETALVAASDDVKAVVNLRIDANNKMNAFNDEKAPFLREQLDAIEAAYVTAKAQKIEAEKALELAKEATEKLLQKLNDTKANTEATEAEIARAQQFYDEAVLSVEKAKANIVLLDAEIAKLTAIVESGMILNSKVLVFGMADAEAHLADAKKNSETVIKGINEVIGYTRKVIDLKAEYNAAKAEYDAAKKIYDELLLVDLTKLPEAEATETRANRIAAAVTMNHAEKAMKLAKDSIDTYTLVFGSRYQIIVTSYADLFAAKAEIEALVAEANALRATEADAQKIYETALESEAAVNEIFANTKAIYDEFIEVARLADFIDEDGELVTNTTANENKPEDKEEVTVNKYEYDDGSVVSVTYGGKNGNDKDAYRTFILNYNSFDVTVTYGEQIYEIGAFGYVVINH